MIRFASAVLAVAALVALTGATPTPAPTPVPTGTSTSAPTSDDPSVVSFMTSGPVELAVDSSGQYFAPGTVYFSVELAFPGGVHDYAATWEHADGPWPGTAELIQAANAYWAAAGQTYTSGCRAAAVRQAFAGYPTVAAFQASPYWTAQRAAYFTAWQTNAALDAAIDTACGTAASAWTWAGVASEWDEAAKALTVRIPFAAYGAGEHQLDVVASTVADTGPQYPADWLTNPACIVSGWSDGPPATVPCGGYTAPRYTVRASTTIDVPDLVTGGVATVQPSAAPAPFAEILFDAQVAGLPVWLYGGIGVVLLLALVGLAIVLALRRRPESPPKDPPARHGSG